MNVGVGVGTAGQDSEMHAQRRRHLHSEQTAVQECDGKPISLISTCIRWTIARRFTQAVSSSNSSNRARDRHNLHSRLMTHTASNRQLRTVVTAMPRFDARLGECSVAESRVHICISAYLPAWW